MRRNLGPEGLLLFDVNTLCSYRSFFAEEVVVEREGKRMIWRGLSSADAPPGSVCEASFEVGAAGGGRRAADRARAAPRAPLPRSRGAGGARRAGLECLDVFGLGHDEGLHQPLDEAESLQGDLHRPRQH